MNSGSSSREVVIDNENKLSDILLKFINSFSKPKITIGEFRDAIPGRSYGILLFLLSLPMLLPIPTPGVSAVIGLPLLFITFQLMIGIKNPWFPKWLLEKSFKRTTMEKLLHKILPFLKKIEKFLKPRMNILVDTKAEKVIAAICFVLSILMVLPIPFGNALPALSMCVFAMGLLQRDGRAVLVGVIFSFISFTVMYQFADAISSMDIF